MVNRLYQAQGRWKEAFEIAEQNDRIHLRHTHYNYAKYLESFGGIETAIEQLVSLVKLTYTNDGVRVSAFGWTGPGFGSV